jgi:hypothetical protein
VTLGDLGWKWVYIGGRAGGWARNRVIADIADIARDRKERSYDEQQGCEEGVDAVQSRSKWTETNEKQGKVTPKSKLEILIRGRGMSTDDTDRKFKNITVDLRG